MRSAEHQVPEAIKHNRATHAGQALHDVRMIANHDIRARGDRPIRHFLLEGVVLIVVLRAPMAAVHNHVAALLAQAVDVTGNHKFVVLVGGFAAAREADFMPVFLPDVGIPIATEGHPRVDERLACGFLARRAVVAMVVVGNVDLLNRPLPECFGVARQPAEAPQATGLLALAVVLERAFKVDEGHVIVRKQALQAAERVCHAILIEVCRQAVRVVPPVFARSQHGVPAEGQHEFGFIGG